MRNDQDPASSKKIWALLLAHIILLFLLRQCHGAHDDGMPASDTLSVSQATSSNSAHQLESLIPSPSPTVLPSPTLMPTVKPVLAKTANIEDEYDALGVVKKRTDVPLDVINEDIDHTPDYSRDYLLHSSCTVKECIEMSIDLKNMNRANFHEQLNSAGEVQYTFEVRAKHNANRSIKKLNAVILGRPDAGKCTVFGNNTVAVLGYTASQNPIISTQQGPMVIHDRNVIIGQAGGLRIFRNQKLTLRVDTPNPFFSAYGLQERAFHLNPNGYLFYKKTKGNVCLAYSSSNPFQSANSENCNYALEEDPNYSPKFEQNAKYHAFTPANNDRNYRVDIYQRSCY